MATRRDGILPHRDYARRAVVQRLVAHLRELGDRAISEFLNEIALEHGIGADIVRKLERYCSLDPKILVALGGNQFAPAPTRRLGAA